MIITIIRRPRREVKGFFIFYVSVRHDFFISKSNLRLTKLLAYGKIKSEVKSAQR